MQRSEVMALGKLAGAAVAGPATLARDVHRAAAGRVFKTLGVVGMPVRVMHDGISSAVYRTVDAGLNTPVVAGARAVARNIAEDALPLADTLTGGLALGALNGAIGDRLARDQRELALELSIRRQGQAIATDSPGLAEAFPNATSKLAVFVHGLCETEGAWRLLPLRGGRHERRSYGDRLRDELGYTPIYVRYNTGLHISDNGRRLAEVLEHVTNGWPTDVDQIALIGHSMGGLVARSGCHYGEAENHVWTGKLKHVFCLGTPHLGAPLERFANVGGWALSRLSETQPFASVINGRSVGIKDLRYGNCVEEDWCDCEPDEFLRDRCKEVPFLPDATYYFIGATLTRRHEGAAATILGDLLVQFPSASGAGKQRRIPFDVDCGLHLGGVNHFQLLNHPSVYAQIRGWLERDRVPRRRQLGAAAVV